MKKICIAIIAMMLAPLAIHAQDDGATKIGIINLNKVMVTSEIGKAAFERIQKYREENENTLAQRRDTLQAEIQQLENQRSLLKEDAYNQRINDLQRRELEFRQAADEYNKNLQRMNREELQAFIKVAGPIIEQIGKDQGFDLIIDPSTQNSQVLYYDSAIDITDIVIERVNSSATASGGSEGGSE